MLTCLGLGSCVSVCALDPVANVSGMAHIMLPQSNPRSNSNKPGTFADTGVQELVNSMEALGADRSRLVCAVAGGASTCTHIGMDFGKRTADAVVQKLKALGVKCAAADLGGTVGRSVTMSTDSGNVTVNTINMGESVLCSLREAA